MTQFKREIVVNLRKSSPQHKATAQRNKGMKNNKKQLTEIKDENGG